MAIDKPHAATALPSIDGLRAVAVTLVLFAHLRGTDGFAAFQSLGIVGDLGNLGVRLFFVVSGFLITHLLLKEEAKTGTVSLRKFYLRRALRIFPAFYAFLAVLGVATVAGLIDVSWNDFLTAATYTTNFDRQRGWYTGHTWSLAVEEQFYLLWPWCFVALAPGNRIKAAAAVLLVAPLFRIAAFIWLPEWRLSIDEMFPGVMDAIGAGACLALVRPTLHQTNGYRRLLASPWIVAVPVAILALNGLNARFTVGGWLAGQTALNLAIAVALDRVVTHPSGLGASLLNTPPAAFVGRLSYSIYLWQQLFLNREGSAAVQSFPINLTLALVAAYGSFRLVERPFLKLKDRIGGSFGRLST